MSKSITIREVPSQVRDELAARAAATGRSLQEYLLSRLIDISRRPDPEVYVARLRERKKQTGSRLPSERILLHREADRR